MSSSIVSPRRGFAMLAVTINDSPAVVRRRAAARPARGPRAVGYDTRTMRTKAPRAVGDLLVAAIPDLAGRLAEERSRRAWAAGVGPGAARRRRPRGGGARAPDRP